MLVKMEDNYGMVLGHKIYIIAVNIMKNCLLSIFLGPLTKYKAGAWARSRSCRTNSN